MALVLAGLAAPGCSTNPVTGKRQLILISRDQEIAMGEEASGQFEEQFGGKVPDEQLLQYVRTVGGKVAAHSDRPMPYEFTLVSSDVPNAFALPGGKVFITAGLLRRMTNERQLAAVLGHEIGHVAARHNVAGMQRQTSAAILVEIAAALAGQDKAEATKAVGEVVAGMASMKYSRDDEYQADQIGVRYMARAGYNPWGMVELLDVLYSLHESEPGSLEEMFQTHPLTSKRIEAAKSTITDDEQYSRFKATEPDAQTGLFLQMRKRLPPVVATVE